MDFRQISIVRQSSVKSAVEYVASQQAVLSINDVLAIAGEIESWVNRTDDPKEYLSKEMTY